MNEKYKLMLEVSKRLSGEVVYPKSQEMTLEEYLFQVAQKKLQSHGNMVALGGTKSMILLHGEQLQEVARELVSRWKQFVGKSLKKLSGSEEETLRALLQYQEK